MLGGGYSIGHENHNSDFGNVYELNDDDISKFHDFYNDFIKFQECPPPSLNIALRRFNFAYTRNFVEDQIMDYLISFESLFLSDSGTNLTYRLSRRIAILLKTKMEDRLELSKKMIKMYNNRSGIAHGDEVNLDLLYSLEIQDILRESIVKLMNNWEQFKNMKSFLEHLDFDSNKIV
jgi:hypothetical protein